MLNKFFFAAERIAAHLQGKGWGGGTVKKEFSSAVALLANRQPKLCVDIGGNKGSYTQQITKKFPACEVVIFEPAQTNVLLLRDKFASNTNVTIESFAVSNSDGHATLFSSEDGSNLASLTKRRLDHFGIDFETTEEIVTITFEKYWREKLNSRKIDFCKIDIEGHELDALSGFGESLRAIDLIQFEFGGCNIDTRTFFQDFWYFFEENGFELYRITPFGTHKMNKYREIDEFFITTNYLAKRIH